MRKNARQDIFLSLLIRVFLISCVIVFFGNPSSVIFCFSAAFILFIITIIFGFMAGGNHGYGPSGL